MTNEKVKITKDHLKLLKEMYVDWWDCEYGAPCIDPKRPYGNSDVEGDIANILGWKIFENADGEKQLSKKQFDRAKELHDEMKDVLQICLCTQSFKEGTYQKKVDYDFTSWRKIN